MLRDSGRCYQLWYAYRIDYTGRALLLTSCLGASALQSPLIMPIFQRPDVPVQYASLQTAELLHNSENFFPPLNLVCTVSNLVLTATCYINRETSASAADKLPLTGAALALSFATTAYALGIMVPRNHRMTALSVEMNKQTEGGKGSKEEKEFRQIQASWRNLNYGESCSWCRGVRLMC